MERDEIIEMARQAGEYADEHHEKHGGWLDAERYYFAKLVAAKEREACAKVCEESQAPHDWNLVVILWIECKKYLAKAIRARGEAT